MPKPCIICLGMNEESAVAIAALVAAGASIKAIAGLPLEASGNTSDFVDLSRVASSHGIEWLPITDANAPDSIAAFQASGADMLFVLGWSQLLSETTIKTFRNGVIGSHPSALPYGRGRAPVAWTILENLRESAVTLFRMQSGVDNGPILKQIHFDIPERPTARIVYDLVAQTLARSFVDLYCDFESGTVSEVTQDQTQASWRSKRVLADGWIDFHSSAEAIDRLVRAVSSPYPGAYSYVNGEKAVFNLALPATGDDLRRKGVPGQILAKREGMLLVQAGDKPLWLGKPDLAGNPSVSLRLGDRIGFRLEDEIYDLRNRLDAIERVIGRLIRE